MKNLLILFVLISQIANAQIQKESSFENPMPGGYTGSCSASYNPWSCIEGSNATYSHQISTSFKRSGASSWRTELRPGDAAVAFGSYRTEMTAITKGQAVATAANTYRISVYIPASASAWVNLTQERIVGFQFHPWVGSNTGGSPSLAMEIKAGKFRRVIRHTNGNTSTSATQTMLTKDYGAVPYDKWIDFEVYYDPAGGATTGRVIINMVVDGVRTRMDDYTGRCLHSWSSWPFWKIGVYDWNINSSGGSAARIVYFDMVAHGKATPTTFESIIGLTAAPPAPNQPPIVSVGANASYPSLTTTFPLDATATDPEGQSMTYLWTQTAGTGVTLSNSTTRNATVTGATDNSTYSFQFRATDAQGAITTVSKSVTIAAANVPPTVTMGVNQSLSQGATTGTITATAADSDGTLASGTWSQLSGPNTAGITSPNDASPGSSSTGLTGLITGTYTFKYQVVDNSGAIASGTVNVTVPAVNQLPVVTPAPPYILLNSATSTTINAVSTDADGTISTRAWTQVSGPNTATIVSASSASTSITGLIVGTYIFLHTATDNSGGQASATVTVEVNNPPVVDFSSIVDFTFDNNTANINVTASATDADGTVVSYAWSSIEGPTVATFTPDNTGNTTITNLRPGSYIVRLTVTDNDGASSSNDYSFTIEAKYIISKFGIKKVLNH